MTDIPEIIKHLSYNDTRALLRQLVQDQAVGSDVADVIAAYWSLTMPNEPQDVEVIAEKIFSELVALQIEKVWTIYDIDRDEIDPYDVAKEMIGKPLEPLIADLELFLSRRLFEQATRLCQGLMRGLYRYACEYSIEKFEEGGFAMPVDYAHSILYEWHGTEPPFMEKGNMLRFVRQELPRWEMLLLSRFTI